MAQGFGRLGHQVTLVCRAPERQEFGVADAETHYGIGPGDNITFHPVHTQSADWQFAFRGIPALLRLQPHLVYTRNYVFPWVTSRLGFPTVAESHAPVGFDSSSFRRQCKATRHRAFRLWVTISPVLQEYYESCGVPQEKIKVLPDAVDIRLFGRPSTLPASPYPPTKKPRIVYAGHLYDYKGIPTIIETAARMPECEFHLVGGLPEDLERQKTRAARLAANNVFFHGPHPHAQVPPYLWHANVLLLPPSGLHPSAQWTSPVKMAEYLASGVPVVSTRIPALEHWLTARETCWANPDDADSLARAIRTVLDDTTYAHRLVETGRTMAENMTYEERAQRILGHRSIAPYLEKALEVHS